MLNHSSYDPLRGFSLDGTAAHVNMGWLLTPGEFARDCLAMKQRPHFDAWSLATQLPDETVRVLQSPLVPKASKVDVMASEQGILYPVITLQSAALQMRLLLSLASSFTQEWLRAVTTSGTVHISLEIPETNQVAVVSMPCTLRAGAAVESLIRECKVVDHEAFVRDAAEAARHLADLEAMPSLIPGFRTQDLRLVLVLESGPNHSGSKAPAKVHALH